MDTNTSGGLIYGATCLAQGLYRAYSPNVHEIERIYGLCSCKINVINLTMLLLDRWWKAVYGIPRFDFARLEHR